jgi:hypothetical protein
MRMTHPSMSDVDDATAAFVELLDVLRKAPGNYRLSILPGCGFAEVEEAAPTGQCMAGDDTGSESTVESAARRRFDEAPPHLTLRATLDAGGAVRRVELVERVRAHLREHMVASDDDLTFVAYRFTRESPKTLELTAYSVDWRGTDEPLGPRIVPVTEPCILSDLLNRTAPTGYKISLPPGTDEGGPDSDEEDTVEGDEEDLEEDLEEDPEEDLEEDPEEATEDSEDVTEDDPDEADEDPEYLLSQQ